MSFQVLQYRFCTRLLQEILIQLSLLIGLLGLCSLEGQVVTVVFFTAWYRDFLGYEHQEAKLSLLKSQARWSS